MFSFSQLKEEALEEIIFDAKQEHLSNSIKKSISCVLNQILFYASSHYLSYEIVSIFLSKNKNRRRN